MQERTSHEQDTQLKGSSTQGKSCLTYLSGDVAVSLALLALFAVVAAVLAFTCRSTSPPSTKAKKKKSVVRHVLPPGVLT